MEPVTSDILRDILVTSSPPEFELAPGVAGKGRPCTLSVLDGSLGPFEPFREEGGVGVVNDKGAAAVVGGTLGRSHDDCPVCVL